MVVADLDLDGYQTYDKALDIHYLTVAYLSTIRNWGRPMAAARVPQHVRVLLHRHRGLQGVPQPGRPDRPHTVVTIAAGIWILVNLPQEWWIHVAQLDVTEFVGEHFSGLGLTAAVAAAAAVGALAAGPRHDVCHRATGGRRSMPTARATIVLYATIVGDGPEPTPLGTVLFPVGLLTLIVVLYDRFQGIAAEQSELDETGRVPARGTWWMPTTG